MPTSPDSDPSSILREAKGLALDLKKTLKSVNPWDRSVDLQRQRLRKHYVHLIFLNNRADMAQQLLWSETSHAIIDVYRSRIQQIERAIAAARTEGNNGGRATSHGPVELRKVSQSFRSFLVQEEKFWRQFSLRLVRSYRLVTATPVLLGVGITEEPVLDNESAGETPAAESVTNLSDKERLSKMDMLQRSIIYLGDLSRYRELNESASNPKKARARTGTETPDRSAPKSFAASEAYYQAAVLLAPQNGTPFNQLAILATYQSNHFDALYYYYRAACTSQPFATVAENIDRLLAKALQTVRRSHVDRVPGMSSRDDHLDRMEVFKQDVVMLHALWARKSRSTSTKVSHSVELAFPVLLAERILPAEVTLRLLLMALAALWRAQLVNPLVRQAEPQSVSGNLSDAEEIILNHALHLLNTLYVIGHGELPPAAQTDVPEISPTLALNISAVFRRILPALRLSSNWLRLHLAYLSHHSSANAAVAERLKHVWRSYATFITSLDGAFPIQNLPPSGQLLEEDITSQGFLPMLDSHNAAGSSNTGLNRLDNPHPNEEHLMRIADLLSDAQTIIRHDPSPFQRSKLHAPILNSGAATMPPAQRSTKMEVEAEAHSGRNDAPTDQPVSLDKDDDISTTTSDDPVSMAMRVALATDISADTDDEDDVVLFPRAPTERPSVESAGPTAQDLLFQVLGSQEPATPKGTPKAVPSGTSATTRSSSGFAQPALLFGSNIWSGPVPSVSPKYPALSAGTPVYGALRLPSHGNPS